MNIWVIWAKNSFNITESTTVDGINLDEIKEFAKQFKIRRLSLGLTQTQVGQALSATEGPAYSQETRVPGEKPPTCRKSLANFIT
jgi:class 6 POU domain transcription factor